ncbi:hypothetical protein RRG08_045285 [Elysia crispata]|uniref:Uncharacterized protein n=1 Tax=Elysia crispata TaxID=231223 RepID=A0AAE1A1J6_9GAST|nr:hypothetical protein RRG08_045285 [Elysia crispata]
MNLGEPPGVAVQSMQHLTHVKTDGCCGCSVRCFVSGQHARCDEPVVGECPARPHASRLDDCLLDSPMCQG